MALTSGVSLRGSFYTHRMGSPPQICAHQGCCSPAAHPAPSHCLAQLHRAAASTLRSSPGRHPNPVPTCLLTPGSSAPPLPSAPFPGSSWPRGSEEGDNGRPPPSLPPLLLLSSTFPGGSLEQNHSLAGPPSPHHVWTPARPGPRLL